jgi:rhamnosyltransferase
VFLIATVVLFHPKKEVFENIRSFLDEVEFVFLIDNSEPGVGSTFLLQFNASERSKILLISNPENFGIAKALNQAATYSIKNKYQWLLTMDQDSSFEKGSLKRMKEFITTTKEVVGIVSPFHLTPKSKQPKFKEVTTRLRFAMTSGNLLNLEVYNKCGAFDEKLFIDSVDHEYCLRLRKNGYQIIRVNEATLYHTLGDIVYHPFLFFRFKTTNHSAARRYYIARNRLYVMFKYLSFDFKFFRRESGHYFKDFLRVIFLEERKTEKLSAIIKGTVHFVIGRSGKF